MNTMLATTDTMILTRMAVIGRRTNSALMDDDAFKAMNDRLTKEKRDLELRLDESKEQPTDKEMQEKVAFSLDFIINMGSSIATAPIDLKLDILGSIFSGKIVFEKNEPRTAELTPLVSIITGKPIDWKPLKHKATPGNLRELQQGCSDYLFSNYFIEDLERLWGLRKWIPDPSDASTWWKEVKNG